MKYKCICGMTTSYTERAKFNHEKKCKILKEYKLKEAIMGVKL